MRRSLLIPLIVIAIGGALIAACGDDSDETAGDAGAMLAALDILESAELHAVELALIEEDATIDPEWLGRLRNARIAIAVIDWPEELQEPAQAFLDQSMPLETALAEDDAEAAGAVVTATHSAFHALNSAGFDFLAEQAGVAGAAHDEEEEHEGEGDDD